MKAEGKMVKIFEIIEENFDCKERSKVRGHTGEIKFVEFSEYDNKIFATFSSDNTLKIWVLDNAFCLCNIPLTNEIYNFQIYKEYIFYFDTKNSYLTRYNYIQYTEFIFKNINEDDFVVLSKKKIAVVTDNYTLVKYYYNKKNGQLKLKEGPLNIYYYKKLKYLYIFFITKINIVDIAKMTIIFEKQITCSRIFYLNNHLNKNIYAKFLVLNGNIEYYTLYKNTNDNINYNVIFAGKKFWKEIVPNISDIENLEWKANIEETFSYKKYLDNEIISEQISQNYKKGLKEKKIEVEKEFDLSKNYKYIQLLMMLIKDNTNKDLVIKYLKYLKEKETQIDFSEKESFQNEYENYKIMFDNEILKSNELQEKKMLEIDNFISLLKEIISLKKDNFDNFKSKVKKKIEKIQLFNQAIDLDNKELYWYRNIFVVYYALDTIFDLEEKEILKSIKLMQGNINLVLNGDYLSKEYILNNNELLTSIIILIALPQSESMTQFNLNLIESADPQYNYLDELNKNKMQKYSTNSRDNSYNFDNFILQNPSNSCISNFVLNIKQGMELDLIELNNYNNMKKAFNEIYEFEKMYKFLSKSICLKSLQRSF